MKKETNRIEKRMSLLYLNNFLRGIGFSFVGIFIPIYLLSKGYSLTFIFIYFLIHHLTTFAFTPVALLISRKTGYKPLILTSHIFVLAFVFFLMFIDQLNIPIYLIAFTIGLQDAFFFIPLHAFFARYTEKAKHGAKFSNYAAFGMLSGLVGPIVGALIATFFGFNTLFPVVSFFLALSVVPLFKLHNFKPETKIVFKRAFTLTKQHKKFFLATILDNTRKETEGIIWPIFTFLALESLISVGYVGFLVTAGTMLVTLFLGRFHDKKDKFLFIKLGGLAYVLIWILRIFLDDSWSVYLLSLGAGFASLMIGISYNAIFYEKASTHKDTDEFVFFIEIPNLIGRAFLWIVMILVADEFKFTAAFILAAIASAFFIFIKFDKN